MYFVLSFVYLFCYKGFFYINNDVMIIKMDVCYELGVKKYGGILFVFRDYLFFFMILFI